MLDWMKGNEGPEAADTSKLLEPPETPAPVFAIRAFKSALFGTPGAEEEQEKQASDPDQHSRQPSKSDTINSIPIPVPDEKEDAKTDDSLFNPSGSPTKSILVTPGTISNRRKTVSFGEGVVDNEGKNDSRSSKVVKTPPNPAGNLTAQWMSGSADGRPRSQLTQTLMDARDNASKNAGPTESSSAQSVARAQPKEDSSAEDITTNLEDPRSESGKYWKTEFDNYRMRTNREIKKLIHYRSIAKSYARKKDSEALRLADKLKEEEEKVVDMERQVTRLASTIAGGNPKANKEDLIQDLTKQTTLALQYKQQVSSLRKSLEQQGVVESKDTKVNEPSNESPSTDTSEELRKAQQELKQAHSEIEQLKRQNSQPENSDLKELRSLSQSSEKKAQELEKENHSLKQTMARVKQEMSRYEGRRKEKETKFRQREIKLEARIQEYRERLKKVTQERRESEDALRANFQEERRHMQSQIDMLKLRASNAERIPVLRSQQHTLSPRKEHTGVQVYDFAESDHPEIEEFTEELEAPPSPSPRTKTRHTRNATTGAFDLKRPSQRITTDDEEVTHYLHEILDRPRPKSYQFDTGLNPPSSPPDTAPLKSLDRNLKTRSHQPSSDKQKSYRSLYLNDPENTNTRLGQNQRSRPHIRSTLDNISGLPNSRTGTYAGNTISGGERTTRRAGLSGIGGDLISPERVAAAQSRLQQKKDSRKLRAMGEGNIRPMVTSGGDEN
ncbi:hypothetical protein PENSTE_c032G03852 [Penicillium steckii]|uniref:Spindle pole body-associated protein cut12 domain-containing protein n=1 Tax=Penicillium steckii TaxID=303698 RepID=A0A1V6SLF0_9EURO|nr:hypothetical protein PENSTE_c032G03852 [Penicillium steckii]